MSTVAKESVKEKLPNADFLANKRSFSAAVGIPAYNEQGRIGLLLGQILQQNDFGINEIILNTSGSTDRTLEEATSVVKRYNAVHLIKIIDDNERAGKAAALDGILKNCSSDIVIFLDGDVKLNNKCFSEILKQFLFDDSVGVVSGNVASLDSEKEGLFSFISKLERQTHHELCVDLMREGMPPKVNGTFFAVKRNVINHLPRHVVSDDEYISWNAQSKGYRVAYAPKAIVYTKDPDNFKDYVAKRRRIFVGHFLIKKTIGYTVPTTRFSKVAPKLLNFLMREKSKALNFLAMLVMQSIAYILAVSDMVLGNIPYRYRVESAKF
jgi:cellulose synthase/poly-beta-1,6-N-acetylglucosamine synthase-like glycosyltransferase